jgi:hypothetical protein
MNNLPVKVQIVERVPMSRDEFISKVANWLPEFKLLSLAVLRMESQGRVRLVRDDGVPVVLYRNGKEMMRFTDG